MDGERRARRPHQGRVVEDVVDVPVRVGNEVQVQAIGGHALDERLRGTHSGVEDERIGRVAVPDEIRVRLPRTERGDLHPHAVLEI
jgi:hypothetical protein